jgi:hypothetical protein
MTRTLQLKIVCVLLLFILCYVGLILAAHKPLWNDEIYSQVFSVENPSYSKILLGKIEEGNNCPLFYFLQKGLISLGGYQSPNQWRQEVTFWHFDRPLDRIVLRIQPVVALALMIVGMFYYFARYFSLGWGALALTLALTNSQLWRFWAEARPYALWELLTAIQILIFLSLVHHHDKKNDLWKWLGLTHFLLSLTVVFAGLQILAVSMGLWSLGRRDARSYIVVAVFPILLTIYYYFVAPKYPFWLEFSLEQYLRSGISRDRIYVLLLYVFALGLWAIQKVFPRLALYRDQSIIEGGPALLMTLGMMLTAVCAYAFFKLHEGPSQTGFPVSDRYFVYLIPVGVVATTVFVHSLFKALRQNVFLMSIIASGITGLLLQRLPKTIAEIQGHYPGLWGR